MDADVKEAMKYLQDGGLGEVIGLTDAAMKAGSPKVQSDTEMVMALCILAHEAIETRESARQDALAAIAKSDADKGYL